MLTDIQIEKIQELIDRLTIDLKYDAKFDFSNIENLIILFYLYRLSNWSNLPVENIECVNCVINAYESTFPTCNTIAETQDYCLLLENSTGTSCGCLKGE